MPLHIKMNQVNKERIIQNAVEIAKFAEKNPKEWEELNKEVKKRLK